MLRFETHRFRHQLVNNAKPEFKDRALTLYKEYFKDNGLTGGLGNEGQFFRLTPESEWQKVHIDSQTTEYNAFNLALSITPDSEYVYRSASYGIGQIMGSNFKEAGYNSARELYIGFSKGYTEQMKGMFSFVESTSLVKYLKNGDLVGFARAYNGDSAYAVRLRNGISEYGKA